MRFVEFWHDLIDHDPQWLYFDSKVVPYSELAKVNRRKIWFVTIRRRGAAILRRLNALPASAWRRAVIDIPKRRHKNIRYLDETVKIRGYPEKLRQVAVAGLGRDEPTLCLSNNFQVSARELITRYVKRNGVEDALGISVNFFHLDCLVSLDRKTARNSDRMLGIPLSHFVVGPSPLERVGVEPVVLLP